MFEAIRKHSKIVMWALFLLIIPSFVFFGIDGYSRMSEKGQAVAEVDGHQILQSEWDNAHRTEVDRMRAQMPNIDAKLFDSPQARYATLEKLVRERVLATAADNAHLTTSDARLARELQQNPSIAALRRADGTLDVERYRQLVGSQGLSPEMFEARVRAELAVQQLSRGISSTAFNATVPADAALNAFFERREVQIRRFDATDYLSRIHPTEADLQAYYQDQQSQFQSPEQASIEYVVLDLDAVKKGITLSEADLKTYYEQNAARFGSAEQRRASHILIAAAKSAPAAERQNARAKAEALLAAVKAAPESFAESARKNSQDPGSAAKGGDLDFFARGAMVKPFEDAAFALKKGDISGVVESDFGFHIIRLTDIKAAKTRSFEETRPELEADLKKQQAQRKFAEVAEVFTNTVYEQSDSLKPVADKLKLELRTAANLGRQPLPGAGGVLANSKFLSALFAPDAIEKKRNTEAIEVAPNQLVAGRITQYAPARSRALEEVKDLLRQRVIAAKADELARKEGQSQLAAWQASGATAANLSAPLVLSRNETQKQPQELVDAALRADTSKLPAWLGVELAGQGFAVLRVNRVLPRETGDAAAQAQGREQFTQRWSNAENLAYIESLKARFKVNIKVAKPSVKPGPDLPGGGTE